MVVKARTGFPGAILLVALLTGCGGDSDGDQASSLSPDEQTAADNLAAQIVRSGNVSGQDSAENGVTEEESGCIAEGAVREVGLEALQDYGILTEDLLVNKSIQGVEMGADDADGLAAVFVECIDAEALFEGRFLSTMRPAEAEEAKECVEDAVDPDSVRSILSSSFQGRPAEDFEELQMKVASCSGERSSGQ